MSEDPVHRPGADPVPGPDPGPESGPDPVPAPVPVTMRRAPRFVPFILSGAGLGALLALAVALWLPDPSALEVGSRAIAGYLVAIGALLGGVLGGGAAVVADRRR